MQEKTVINVSKLRDNILDALCSIPLAMEKAKLVKELYQRSQRLQDAFSSFYLAVVNASLAMVEWLLDNSFWSKTKELAKAFVVQDHYGYELNKSLASVDKCADEVKEESDLCHKQEVRQINMNQTSSTRV